MEYKIKTLQLHNQILETKSDYLKALEDHYKNYWLKLDLQAHKLVLDSIDSKESYNSYLTSAKKLQVLSSELEEENLRLTKQIEEAQKRLDKFNGLDPNLLAEFRRLKDDLECQELLMTIGDVNVDSEINLDC